MIDGVAADIHAGRYQSAHLTVVHHQVVRQRRRGSVRDLLDNRWLHLFALDEAGRMAWRYAGDLAWERMAGAMPVAVPAELAA